MERREPKLQDSFGETPDRSIIDRIAEPESSRVRFAPRALPGDVDALTFVERNTSAMPRKYDVSVLVHRDATTVARSVMGWGKVDPAEPDPATGEPRCRVTMSADWLDGPLDDRPATQTPEAAE